MFIETATGAGIVPTRELDLPPGGDPRRAFPVGKQVRVVPIGTDDKGRTRFSMRRVEDEEARANFRQFRAKQAKTASRRIIPVTDNLRAWLAPFPRQGKVV